MSDFDLNNNIMFSFGKDRYNFQYIREEFNRAENITISTFDISVWDDRNGNHNIGRLLRELQRLENKKITIISNVPKRISATWRDIYRQDHYNVEDEHDEINRYLYALDPVNFTSPTKVYINFDNHSKIYIADDLIYVGSANLSDGSLHNFEGGLTFRDEGIATQLRSIIRDEMINDSETIIYAGGDLISLNEISEELSSIITKVEEFCDDAFCDDNFIKDDLGNIIEYIFPKNFEELMLDVIEKIEDCQRTLNRINNITNKYDEVNEIVSRLNAGANEITAIAESEDFKKLIRFNRDEYAQNYFDDNSSNFVDGEEIETLMKIAAYEAHMSEIDILNKVSNRFKTFRDGIEELRDNADAFIFRVRTIEEIEQLIDDTGVE